MLLGGPGSARPELDPRRATDGVVSLVHLPFISFILFVPRRTGISLGSAMLVRSVRDVHTLARVER